MPVTLGSSGITFSNGTTQTTAATGTVSSVTVSAGSGLSGGGTVTSSGTITLSNAGVTSLSAGTGISLSGSTGGVTITNSQPASTTYGAIGTYVIAFTATLSGGETYLAGDTYAGSSLVRRNNSSDLSYALNSFVNNGNTFTPYYIHNTSDYSYNLGLSGTWRFMTAVKGSSYTTPLPALFVRIS